MASFESTLARMKDLYTYGKELNESNKASVHTLEYSAKAADGNTYGIIRECNKFYIKSAPKGKERIAEAYEYLGGYCNKKNYEYTSYANALKNFELKMASINEACDANVNISTLDPFKKGEFIVEGTEKMKNEIARQRQIMYNASMIMNESTEIGANRKDDVVKYDGKQPEAATGKKGDEGMTKATAKPDYAGSKTNGVDKKVAPFNNNTTKCEDQLKENCECGDGACDCNKDWASKGMGKGRDPKQVGWDIEGQTQVNEEEDDWASKGLPSSAGVGEADTDKNNMPFNKTINEEEDVEFSDDEMENDVDFGVEDDVEGDDMDFEGEEDFDAEDDMEFGDDEDFDMEDDMDFEGEEELESDTVSGNEDIMAQIEQLQAQIDALKAQIDGSEETESEFEDDMDFEGEEDFGTEDDMDFEGEDDMDFEGEEDFDVEDDMNMEDGMDMEDDMDMEGDMDVDDNEDMVAESKRRTMNSIIESVVSEILNEDELHAWGKHPGYQKKPMELPSTGEDKNQWGEDWNDESVYSEQPFGTKIGDSAPFEEIVDAVTKSVMSKLSEAANKKKVK